MTRLFGTGTTQQGKGFGRRSAEEIARLKSIPRPIASPPRVAAASQIKFQPRVKPQPRVRIAPALPREKPVRQKTAKVYQGRISARAMIVMATILVGCMSTGGGALKDIASQALAASFRAVVPQLAGSFSAPQLIQIAAPVAVTPPPATPPPAEAGANAPETDYIPDPPPSEADAKYQVQAIMVAKSSAILSSALDARISSFPFKSGDLFNKGDTLAEFDCGVDRGRLREVEARAQLTAQQLKAYQQLSKLKTISKIELDTAVANHAQNLAQIEQVNQRLKLCKIVAPFDGIVTHRMVNQYEFVQTGRVLMDIASREPLQSEFLVPSVWLRWLNVGTPLAIYVDESGRRYDARLMRISGEVDPVSQSVQVTAELSSYHEELLPGMSGRATFSAGGQDPVARFGYHGLILQPPQPPPQKAMPAPKKKK